jgi:hypothetical protein
VVLEVDNAPPGATVDLRLGQQTDGRFVASETRTLTSPRDLELGFSPKGPTGGLAFSAAISDWQVPLSITGASGQRLLLARLLDAAGATLASDEQSVYMGAIPPQGVRFLDIPKQAVKSAPIAVRASGFDSESGVAKVLFFLGKPADGKIPPNITTIAAQPLGAGNTVWGANVAMPPQSGPADLSVAFVNNIGLQAFATATINVVDALPTKNGRILGAVLEGTVRQPAQQVYLLDPKSKAKDKVVAQTNSDATGAFQFENVVPGNYYVFCQKPSTQRQALVPVDVESGKIVTVNLTLSLQKPAAAKP